MKISKHIVFAILIGLVYLAIIARALGGEITASEQVVKFTGLVLCLLYALTGQDHLLKIALSFTALSDIFLLFTPHYAIGVSVFSIAQCIHALRFIRLHRLREKLLLLPAAMGTVLAVALWLLTRQILAAACAVYACFFLFNVVMALALFFRSRSLKLKQPHLPWQCALGMALFLGCDIWVVLFNLLGVGGRIIWLFYLPSQWLLAASGQSFSRANAAKP